MKIHAVKLAHDEDCWMCSIYTKRNSSGKLLDHKHAGAECRGCNRHVHSKDGALCIACAK